MSRQVRRRLVGRWSAMRFALLALVLGSVAVSQPAQARAPETLDQLFQSLAQAGIPEDSVVVQSNPTLYYYYSGSIIGSVQRPALSGIELGTAAGGRCTIGLHAWFPVGWWKQLGFITAGHCGKSGSIFADAFTQPATADVIAHEHFNPHFVASSDCPESFLC